MAKGILHLILRFSPWRLTRCQCSSVLPFSGSSAILAAPHHLTLVMLSIMIVDFNNFSSKLLIQISFIVVLIPSSRNNWLIARAHQSLLGSRSFTTTQRRTKTFSQRRRVWVLVRCAFARAYPWSCVVKCFILCRYDPWRLSQLAALVHFPR